MHPRSVHWNCTLNNFTRSWVHSTPPHSIRRLIKFSNSILPRSIRIAWPPRPDATGVRCGAVHTQLYGQSTSRGIAIRRRLPYCPDGPRVLFCPALFSSIPSHPIQFCSNVQPYPLCRGSTGRGAARLKTGAGASSEFRVYDILPRARSHPVATKTHRPVRLGPIRRRPCALAAAEFASVRAPCAAPSSIVGGVRVIDETPGPGTAFGARDGEVIP